MAYFFSPIGNTQIIDANGDPLVGGTIETYLAGTTTPETTYTDDTGGTAQGVVMTLNSLGYPTNGPVWMLGGVPLKFIIKNALGVVQSTFDDVSGIGDTSTVPDQWQLFGTAPTYISATSFSVVGDQTNLFQAQRRLKSTNNGGTVYSTVSGPSFGAGITTVTVVNTSGVLDVGMSAVSYGGITPIDSSMPNIFSMPPTRQTVLSGPVATSGLSSFGGSTGSGTVTATGTLIVTAANGYGLYTATDRRGQITNPSWTGLTTNGTMYLYLDISAGGVCTPGAGTLAPTYRPGGADVTTNNQFTFNWVEMVGKVGNGSAAVQTYRVYVGEVTVAGAVVTAITWYTMGNRFQTADQACTATATQTTFTHNFGVPDLEILACLRCGTVQANIVAGQVVSPAMTNNGTAYAPLQPAQISRNQCTLTTGSSTAYVAWDRLTGNISSLTSGNFTQFIIAKRPW